MDAHGRIELVLKGHGELQHEDELARHAHSRGLVDGDLRDI